MVSAGIQFNSLIHGNQFLQDFIQDILVSPIGIFMVFIRTVSDNIVKVSIDIKTIVNRQILQDGFKIFHITSEFFAAFKKIRIIRVIPMDYMGGADHKVKGSILCQIVEIFFKLGLEPKLNAETKLYFILIDFL